MIAVMKDSVFLMMVILMPKYSLSMGNVNIPTIISVVVNAESTMYETPFSSRIPHSGKVINPGMNVIEPITDAIITDIPLLYWVRYREITLSGTNVSISEMRISIIRKAGSIVNNFFNAIFNASKVFLMSIINESINKTPAEIYSSIISVFVPLCLFFCHFNTKTLYYPVDKIKV